MKRYIYTMSGLIFLGLFLLWPLAVSAQFNGNSGRIPSLAIPFGVIAGGNLIYQAYRTPSAPAINIVAKILLFIAGFLLIYEVYLYFKL
jgi:hypothetical protein